MLKVTLTALVVFFAVLPGRLTATTSIFQNASVSLTVPSGNGEIDPQLIEEILKEAAQKLALDANDLVKGYNSGELVIEKQPSGYVLVETKGGLTIAIVEEF